jgi:SAM-dependent methyltransferase
MKKMSDFMNEEKATHTGKGDIRCPCCSSADSEVIFQKMGDRLFETTDSLFEFRLCHGCHIFFLSNQLSEHELKQYYPKTYWIAPTARTTFRDTLMELYRRVALSHHLHFFRKIIQNQCEKPPKLLDVGCGDGLFLKECGIRCAFGIDISEHAVLSAKSRKTNVVRGSFLRHPFKDNAFSVITMYHFLEHITDIRSCLTAAKSLLREDGDLVIQVPNMDSFQAKLFGKRWSGLDVPRHLIGFSVKTLCSNLSENGFRIIQKTHFSLRDNAVMFVSSILPRLYPLSRASRKLARPGIWHLMSDIIFFGFTLAALPLTLLESFAEHGATITVHAKPSRNKSKAIPYPPEVENVSEVNFS